MDESGPASTMKLLGGRPSLDFANTADWHVSDQPVEYLTSYTELVAWGLHAGTLTSPQAQQLLAEAARRPEDAAALLQRAIALREAIFGIFSDIASGDAPQAPDLDLFNVELSNALAHSRIALARDGFSWEWTGGDVALDRMLWPVLHDAADLLISGDLDRVGQCADDRCGWLFLDMSRNRSRRWCSMEDCGNRAKVREHYQRTRARAPRSSV
jgi:predicted RNA-binding Zn ribbon-like protein